MLGTYAGHAERVEIAMNMKKLASDSIIPELKAQAELAIPMILVNLLIFAVPSIAVMFAGHISDLALSSAALASSITNVTGLSLLIGLASALDTLCGQAYGAKQYSAVGLYLHRGIIVLYACSIPFAFIWANMKHILLALGQETEISSGAGEYTLWLIPTLFAYSTLVPLIRYMQSQGLVIPIVICCTCTVCCHVPLCYALIFTAGLEIRGAALATSISTLINTGLLGFYFCFSTACEKTRIPFSLKAFHDLKGFFKISVPSALMMCLEWWSYEALVIGSGWLSNPELETSVISVCYNCAAYAFMVPSGLGSMASTRVSNELGAGRPDAARLAVYVSTGVAICEGILVSVTFISLRNVLGKVYSADDEVIAYIAKMMPILAVTCMIDSIQGLLSGIARGCGWQKAGAYINLASYYFVGLPAAFLLAFVFHARAEGLWLGISTGAVVQLIALIGITWASDWTNEVTKAANRITLPQDVLRPLLS